MKLKGLLVGLLILYPISGFISTPSYASTGWCTPANGSSNVLTYDFGSKQISDSTQNKAGTSFPDAYTWNLGTSYLATCDCGSGNDYNSNYFETKTALPLGHSDGTLQYYKINDYLEGATSVYIGGGRKEYVPTPWENESNNYPSTDYSQCNANYSFSTGAQGKLSLYITKSFIGVSEINVNMLDIYSSSVSGSFGGIPLVSLYVQGQVIVPQTCSINAGQIVTVDFGSFMSGEFKNKGQMPAGYTPKTISVPIKCNGMDANASLTLRFQAEASADEPAAIKTSNDDVGVQITDDSGKVIEPNSGLLPFQLDDNLQATVTFHAAPISTTGNAPAEGTFSATAYIRVDFA
ncbi:fimbrial protein [Klebsiella michiganensis]|uniref:fimbrial protein n=1 Tax=Klebsiella michiganensis TaxID=1134687 RepID=UPI0015E5759D|nr:fimbrial protein [Klebsiella michiganensis]QLP45703.1 fimbrial protein [Klebsiella michiganensis]